LLTFVVETPCFSAIQTKEEMEHRVREERYIQQLSMGNRRLTLAARKPRNALKDNSVDFVE
jgi:ABC-type molybdenum transport system ATPase subunit/photorepair protein PhrA